MKIFTCFRAALAALAVCLAVAAPARGALMTLTLSDGSRTESFTDNGGGFINENNLVFGKWTFSELTAQFPAAGGSANSDILLGLGWGVTSAANNRSTLTITLTGNDFGAMTSSSGMAGLSLQGTQSSSGGPGKVFQAGWINESEVVSQGTFATGSFGGSTDALVSDLLGPDCFCEELIINGHSGKATSSGGSAIFSVSTQPNPPLVAVPVPEPSTAFAVVITLILISAGLFRRMPRKSSKRS